MIAIYILPAPAHPKRPRGRRRKLRRIIDATPVPKKLDVEGLRIVSNIDILEWEKTVVRTALVAGLGPNLEFKILEKMSARMVESAGGVFILRP